MRPNINSFTLSFWFWRGGVQGGWEITKHETINRHSPAMCRQRLILLCLLLCQLSPAVGCLSLSIPVCMEFLIKKEPRRQGPLIPNILINY